MDTRGMDIIGNLYWHQSATVIVGHQLTDLVEIKRGVHQGCILFPLFNLYFKEVFKEVFTA